MSRSSGWHVLVAFCALLALFAARLGDTAVRKSFTVDEPQYVGAGLYLWGSGDYDFVAVLSLHPPLAFHLASLPLLAYDLGDVSMEPGLARRLLESEEPGARALRIGARIPFLLLSCWGAFLCFAWAREVAGDEAGLLAAFLFTFSPTVLANGALAHSDITITVLFLQTLYALWRWATAPGAIRLLLFGVSLGLALIAKLSSLLLLVGVAALALLIALRPLVRPSLPAPGPDAPGARGWWVLRAAGASLAVALAVVWIGYGGSFRITTLDYGPVQGIPLPAWVLSFLFDRVANEGGRKVYLLGEIASGGWWYYFPVAFAAKVPVAISGLLVLAVAAPAVRPSRLGWWLGIPVAIYAFVACFVLRVPLGIRYLLPIFPLLFVFAATQLAPLGRGWRRIVVGAACAWLAAASLWIHPHYLAYFNELAGGPARGHRILLDSNIDWGQDLGTLAEWLAERGNPPVWLAYFGYEKPEDYGIRARKLAGCRPVSGLVAISANVREGLYRPNLKMGEPKPGCYDWLAARVPVAHLGYSIFVYDLRDSGAAK